MWLTVIVITLNSCLAHADGLEKYIVTVGATNGLTLGVTILDPRFGTNTTELPIGLLFKAPTNTHSALYLPQEEYLARLELYDSSNSPVAKTALGSKYGKSFDDLYWDLKKFATPPNGWHPSEMFTPDDKWDSMSWGGRLPKISDLFAITKPGTYRLKLEVQIMLRFLNTSDKPTRQILRFPPVEISVIKPEDILPSKIQTNSLAK